MTKTRRYLSNNIMCPYCKSEEKQIIYCQGVQVDSALHLAFAYPEDKVRYKEKYCEEFYKECPIEKMLEAIDG